MELTLPLLSHSAWSCLLLALVSSFVTLPTSYHPLPFFRLLLMKMAGKVHDENTSKRYLACASILLTCLVVSCSTVLLVGIINFAEYPIAFEILILFLLVQNPLTDPRQKRIKLLIEQKQKAAAKETMTVFLRRDTSQLSEAGLIKALIESQSLNYVRGFFLPLFFYYLLGFTMSLCYCVSMHCSQAYSKIFLPDDPFSKATNQVIYWLEYLPLRLFCLPLLLKPATQGFRYLRLYVINSYQKNSVFLLCCLSSFIKIQLGGPANYHDKRYSKVRIGPKALPQISDIKKTAEALIFASLFWLLLLLLMDTIYVSTYAI